MTTQDAPPSEELRERVAGLMLRDRRRLERRLHPRRPGEGAARLLAEVEAAEQRIARRRAGVPVVSYPPDLPVSLAVEELRTAIAEHQIVVVAGATGSGKTTQLPKICLQLGRGITGLIGHTQPRRIAARTVAERIAAELGVELGQQVGYAVRFTDRVGDDTLVKIMTDGILLAEVQRDRDLLAYDTIIIDEAHERSLNVDFLLGYLAQLLPRRPDLLVIITSATIDPGRFAAHFGGAPVVEVSGRTYPVEVRYRPLVDPDDPGAEERDQTTAVVEAVAELSRAGPGDVLVFLSGEREIRDTADALRGAGLAQTEVLPLYARLSAAEQHKVFDARDGHRRRVVLATNVAETSLTVPGIRYVVDPGLARISRWSRRTRVQRLPIEKISQASAAQRAGRCGRVAEGICIRLFTEDDLIGRPEFTDPEILRTDLAAIVLRMAALGLGDIAAFPFLDPPDRRDIRDAQALLHELGALERADGDPVLTALGRRLARLPLDPRLGRMLLAADQLGCVSEVLVIVAALAIQDPRERPTDAAQAATQAHARFADPTSDFLAFLNLWGYLREQQRALSSGAFRRMCRSDFLHYQRVREWQDLHGQLRGILAELGVASSTAPDPDLVHQALLAGLLSHVGLRDDRARDFQGARGARFVLGRDSALAKKPPRWVVAAELVETTRLWGRTAARIEPEWVEGLAEHLVQRTHSEPHWDSRRGSVVAFERVTLYGIPLVASRRVGYGRIDPKLSRDLFLQHALVEGEWETRHAFARHNRALLAEVDELEQRARRRDLRLSDARLFDFYDARVGADVVSGRHFDSWWKAARRDDPELLTLTREQLVEDRAEGVTDDAFPLVWTSGALELPLRYVFEPGTPEDGVTLDVPLAVLNQLQPGQLQWQVPGLRLELVTALLRGLPKQWRRLLGPAPDLARELLPRLDPGERPLVDVLAPALRRATGVDVPREAWGQGDVPPHLLVNCRVLDAAGAVLAEGKDLAALQRKLAPRMAEALAEAGDGLERGGMRDWQLDTLPRTVERSTVGGTAIGYPALVDEGDSVAVRVLPTATAQAAAMRTGTRRLLLLTLPSPMKAMRARLDPRRALQLGAAPHGSVAALLADCVACAADDRITAHGGPAWDAAAFGALREAVRPELDVVAVDVLAVVGRVLAAAGDVERALDQAGPGATGAVADVREQVRALLPDGFVAATGRVRLPDLERYLRAAQRRLERAALDPARDQVLQGRVEVVQAEWARAVARLPPGAPRPLALQQVRWMLEELRVSLFAQALGTRGSVSEQRILRALDALDG